MGNQSTKEARDPTSPRATSRPSHVPAATQQAHQQDPSRPRNRASRSDLGSILGISAHAATSSTQPPYERRETKQEREARRLERERQNRLIERERSLKEEHVDGGYLVTLGTYVGSEDFSKPTVRQLQIERKLAPFWRGLNDFSETWAEHQIIAVARGLPLPAANETPPEDLVPRPMSADSPATSSHNLNSLTVPIGDRTQSAASDKSGTGLGSTIPSPITATATAGSSATRNSSPFKHRPKALAAALSLGSRNGSTTDIAPREIKLPHDPFVNGQALEVFLYKDAAECPICFLYYPPYLNHTRCCDQPICSECFVQIKRADPHYPEGHGDNGEQNPGGAANPEEQAGLLISEPACCPYCQQAELGVTYEPPPFRRGLAYSAGGSSSLGVGAQLGTAMSSSSSLNSTALSSPTSVTSPASGLAGNTQRRRTQSLSANAPNVITTDRVRPDWATKLAGQRAHVARRAAAATALHTAAFLMSNAEARPLRVGRFSRRNTGGGSGPGLGASAVAAASAGVAASAMRVVGSDGGRTPGSSSVALHGGYSPGGAESPGGALGGAGSPAAIAAAAAAGARRSRMEDLEEMMFAEAVRLSLAAEEERKRKAEKEERKEAKRKEKEERKAAKAAAKGSSSGPYGLGVGGGGGGSGHSSASGSALSLPGLGLGRRRGNSAASNLRVEASVASAMAASVGGASAMVANAAGHNNNAATAPDKGKGVDRSPSGQESTATGWSSSSNSNTNTNTNTNSGGGGATDQHSGYPTTGAQPIPSPSHRPAGPSHLRQMSSASSVTTASLSDTPAGSYPGQSHLHDPRASGLSLGSRGSANDSEDGGGGGGSRADDKDPSASTEPMFNFNSLAQMVGVQLEGENAGRRLSAIGRDALAAKAAGGGAAAPEAGRDGAGADPEGRPHVEDRDGGEEGNPGATKSSTVLAPRTTPELMITPGTPGLTDDDGIEDSKQLGFHQTMVEHATPRESVG